MASNDAINDTVENRGVDAVRLAGYGVTALVAVCIVNVVVLSAGLALFEYPSEFVGGPFGPLAVGPVLVNSVVAAVGATIVYGIVARFSTYPNRTFTRTAAAVLVLSFGMLLTPHLAGAPLSVYGTLAVMHVTAAVVIVGVLTHGSDTASTAPADGVTP